MNRKRLLLASLLLILLLAVGYSIYSSPQQKRVSAQQSPRTPRKVDSPEQKSPPSVGESGLRTELLQPEERRYSGVYRDLFYGEEPKVVKPAPPPKIVPPPVIVPPPAVIPPPSIISMETRMELGRFVFLGYLEKNAIKTIFLGAGEEVFVVKKGERFGNKGEFLIVELTPTQMTVRDRDNPMLIVLPLVEKEALKPLTEEALRGKMGTSNLPDTIIDDQSADSPEESPLEEPSTQEEALMPTEQTEGQTNGSNEE